MRKIKTKQLLDAQLREWMWGILEEKGENTKERGKRSRQIDIEIKVSRKETWKIEIDKNIT